MGFGHQLWTQIGITPAGAVGVVLASIVLYALYAGVLAFWGPRLFSSPSPLSLALLTVFGGIFARAMLGNSPTLLGGLIAAVTLLVLEAALGRMRATVGRRAHWHARRPTVVVIEGRPLPDMLHRMRLRPEDLLSRLRASGVRSLDDAAVVIMEPRGTLTVLRRGETLDAALLSGVAGADAIPERHLHR